MRLPPSALSLITLGLLVSGCGRDAEPTEEPGAACCAFDVRVDVRVLTAGGTPSTPEAGVAGVPVRLARLGSDAEWRDTTDAEGRATFGPGVEAAFLVSVEPPVGYAMEPGQAPADTVRLTREGDASTTFRLLRLAPPSPAP